MHCLAILAPTQVNQNYSVRYILRDTHRVEVQNILDTHPLGPKSGVLMRVS